MHSLQKNKKRVLYFPKTLSSFTESCLSLTPKVYAIKESLYLDIDPTITLFGGEEILFLKATQLASSFDLPNQFVFTDRCEWAKAFHTQPEVFLPAGKSRDTLLLLDITRLEFIGDPQTLEDEAPSRRDLIRFMKRVGIKKISDFAALSPTAIGGRFGKMGVTLLDWVSGEGELILPPFIPEETLIERLQTDEITSLESLLQCLRPTLDRIKVRLQGRSQMAKTLQLKFYLESRKKIEKKWSLSEPTQESETLFYLLKEFLTEMIWDSPLQTLEIIITDTIPYVRGQLSLFENKEAVFSDLAEYLTKLRAKFGEAQVGFPALQESYLPERSWQPVWPPQEVTFQILMENEKHYSTSHRPLFLFIPPKICYPLASWKLISTENLMTEWWTEKGGRRYFIALPPQGNRLWVYWDLEEKVWYAHGTFD